MDERFHEFTLGAHWGCPVMWLTIHDRLPAVDGRKAREGNGLVLTRLQALEFAWVMECYGRTGEMPEKRDKEKWLGWVEMLRSEGVVVEMGAVDGG